MISMSIKDKYYKRNSSVELFRMVAMFSIVLIHTFGHGSGLDYDWIYSLGNDYSTAGHLALFSFGHAGVTCFMFISGYYGIRLNGRKMLTMVLMQAFYIVLCALLMGSFSFGVFALLLHPWDGWWFIKCYMFICVLSPIINTGIEKLSEVQFRWIVIGMLLYGYFGHFIGMQNGHDTDLLLTIFMVGRYLAIYPPHISKKCLQISILSAIILALMPIAIIQITHNNTLMKLFLNNNNPLLLVFAASTVMTLDKRPFHSALVNWLAGSTLAIYLITDNSGLRSVLNPWLLSHVMESPIVGYGLMAAVCLACLLVDKVRELLFFPFNKLLDKAHDRGLGA